MIAPPDGDVHVWDATIADLLPLRPRLEATLSAHERRRAARYRFPEHREAFAIRRGLLRALIGAYVGAAPAAIELDETCRHCGRDHGKPRLPGDADLDFSLSHSGGRVLMAFARGAEIGVDVERVADGADWAGPASLTLSPAERAELDALPEDRRAQRFYLLWARKEALTKATGHGLVLPLREIDLTPNGELRALPQAAGPPEDWTLHDLHAGAPYAAALAVRGRVSAVRMMGAPDVVA